MLTLNSINSDYSTTGYSLVGKDCRAKGLPDILLLVLDVIRFGDFLNLLVLTHIINIF